MIKSVFAGNNIYIPLEKILPSQVRYSEANVIEKMKKFQNMSSLPEREAVPVIETSFGFVLIDGHHTVMACERLGIKEIPVKIIETTKLPKDKFWKYAEKKGYSYLYDIEGRLVNPPQSFKDLKNDPLRYFASITALKCKKGNIITSKFYDYPLWVKLDKDIPFIEFKISNTLHKNGFTYKDNDPLTEENVELARKILTEHKIKGLKLIEKREKYDESKYIKDTCK